MTIFLAEAHVIYDVLKHIQTNIYTNYIIYKHNQNLVKYNALLKTK